MKKGTVKFFNESKGFGFIKPEEGSRDLFVHSTGLTEKIREGDTVVFEIQETPKGPSAVNVKRA